MFSQNGNYNSGAATKNAFSAGAIDTNTVNQPDASGYEH
jgi:hypothetical protein